MIIVVPPGGVVLVGGVIVPVPVPVPVPPTAVDESPAPFPDTLIVYKVFVQTLFKALTDTVYMPSVTSGGTVNVMLVPSVLGMSSIS